jgi:hypothetical protein
MAAQTARDSRPSGADNVSAAEGTTDSTEGTGHPWLDAIINMLPLGGALKKAGDAMDGKK